MATLIVTTQAVVDVLKSQGHSVTVLNDHNKLVKLLSAHDLAEMELATEEFPFQFDGELDIQMASSPLSWLQYGDKYTNMYERVNGRVDTLRIQKPGGDIGIPTYLFEAIDGQCWVAVMQRHPEQNNPRQTLLSANYLFFKDMIAQVMHMLSFESMCKTNLFAYYLKAYTPHWAGE